MGLFSDQEQIPSDDSIFNPNLFLTIYPTAAPNLNFTPIANPNPNSNQIHNQNPNCNQHNHQNLHSDQFNNLNPNPSPISNQYSNQNPSFDQYNQNPSFDQYYKQNHTFDQYNNENLNSNQFNNQYYHNQNPYPYPHPYPYPYPNPYPSTILNPNQNYSQNINPNPNPNQSLHPNVNSNQSLHHNPSSSHNPNPHMKLMEDDELCEYMDFGDLAGHINPSTTPGNASLEMGAPYLMSFSSSPPLYSLPFFAYQTSPLHINSPSVGFDSEIDLSNIQSFLRCLYDFFFNADQDQNLEEIWLITRARS